MIRVAGLWSLGWTTPYTEYDDWAFLLDDFAVDEWWMAPVTGMDRGVSSILDEQPEILDILYDARVRNDSIVYVDENGESCLTADCPDHPYFSHPTGDVLYVFGRGGTSPYLDHAEPGEISVRFQTPYEKAGMWGHQAAALILYDRHMRS